MDGKTAIANILKQEGVEYLFCFPNNPIIDAASAAGIRPVLSRMERCAVNMADGYTRALNGRQTGVLAVQGGPGIENAFGGIAQAYADSVPILILPGHPGTHRTGMSSIFSASQSYQRVTKWVELINHPKRVPEMMRRAFTYLRSGRPGPVMLEVPGDVSSGQVDEEEFNYTPVRRIRSAGNPQDVADVARAMLKARLPVVYAGQGCLYAEASDELVELAELLQIPVMTTTLGKSAFPENHPLSIGTGGTTMTRMVTHFLNKCDLVFGIGTSFQKTLASASVPPGKVMVQATIDERDLNGEYPIDYAIIGDAKLVLQQLIQEVRRQAGSAGPEGNDVAREIKAVKDAWLKEWMPRLTSDEVPINPYRVIWDLMHTVDRTQTVVTHDSGNPRDQMVPFYEAITPRSYLGWGNSTQLGTGLGLALGAKMATPQKLVVNVMGDTAVGMAGIDFETAVRERIPIMTIILNNSAMGGYEKNLPIAVERYGIKYMTGDYAKVTQGLGAYSERVEKPADIVPAIKRAREITKAGGHAVLEVITREDPVFSS